MTIFIADWTKFFAVSLAISCLLNTMQSRVFSTLGKIWDLE
jgi:hypothetical protein